MAVMLHAGHIDACQLPALGHQTGAQIELLEGMQIAVGEIAQIAQRAQPIEPAAVEPVDLLRGRLALGLVVAGACLEFDALRVGLDHLPRHGGVAGMFAQKGDARTQHLGLEHHVAVEQIEVILPARRLQRA